MYYVKLKKEQINKADKLIQNHFTIEYSKETFSFDENVLNIDSDHVDLLDEIVWCLEDNGVAVLYCELDCLECEGTGEIEVDNRQFCGKPASDCCGGCYDTYQCDSCDGVGKMDY